MTPAPAVIDRGLSKGIVKNEKDIILATVFLKENELCVETNSSQRLEKMKILLKKGDFKLATDELLAALQKSIENGDNRFQLAMKFNNKKTEDAPPEFGVTWEQKNISMSLKLLF